MRAPTIRGEFITYTVGRGFAPAVATDIRKLRREQAPALLYNVNLCCNVGVDATSTQSRGDAQNLGNMNILKRFRAQHFLLKAHIDVRRYRLAYAQHFKLCAVEHRREAGGDKAVSEIKPSAALSYFGVLRGLCDVLNLDCQRFVRVFFF